MDVPAPSRPLRIIGVPDPRPLDPPPISHLPLLHETAMALAHLKALRRAVEESPSRMMRERLGAALAGLTVDVLRDSRRGRGDRGSFFR